MNARTTTTTTIAAPRLSRTSKLGTLSWSLQARDTCPGAVGADGSLVPACSGCYAVGGNYRFSNVKAPREHNKDDWQAEGWVDAMVALLDGQTHFRWFDSGDAYSLALAEKILDVMRRTPNTLHWMPTRMHKFAKFRPVLAAMEALPNAIVRRSSDSVTGEYTSGVHGSVIIPSADHPTPAFVCGAYSRGGKCGDCRACYDKSVPVIAYPAHGKTMARVVRIAQEERIAA